jgi:hypothetical protein
LKAINLLAGVEAYTILDARILDFGLHKPSGGNGFNV